MSNNVIEGNYAEMIVSARKSGMNEGIWLCIQELVHAGYEQAASGIMVSTGLTEGECVSLQDNSGGFEDEMKKFISSYFNNVDEDDDDNPHEALSSGMLYHPIGEVFDMKIGGVMKKVKFVGVDDPMNPCGGCIMRDTILSCEGIACSPGENSDMFDTKIVLSENEE